MDILSEIQPATSPGLACKEIGRTFTRSENKVVSVKLIIKKRSEKTIKQKDNGRFSGDGAAQSRLI